ncbi:MAG: hypothetical protein M1541_06395, partial [Acidobacteria bacterium]|nr:hypothetical protein [Acidobacteriota bacterium]
LPGPPALDRVIRGCLTKEPEQRRQRIQTALLELKLIRPARRPRPKREFAPLAEPAESAAPAREETAPPAHPSIVIPEDAGAHSIFIPEPPRKAAAPAAARSPARVTAQAKPPELLFWGIRRKWLRLGRVALAAAVLMVLAAAAGAYLRRTPAQTGTVRFSVELPEEGAAPGTPSLAPDGSALVFAAVGTDGKSRLWIRPLDALKPSLLAGTDDAMAPFWSPDSRMIGYFSGGKLKKINAAGGFSEKICDTGEIAGGGTWNQDGVIVFGKSLSDGLYRVPAGGGEPKRLTTPNRKEHERAHLWPRFLPDGNHFLYFALNESDEKSGIYVGELDSTEARRIASADTNGVFGTNPDPGTSGYLIFMRGRRIIAQQFEPGNAELNGNPLTLAEDVGFVQSLSLEPVSASNNGLLAYQKVEATKRQLVWYDREGHRLGYLGEPGNYGPARISHDASRVAVNRVGAGSETADLWLMDTATGSATQFTSGVTHEGSPVWSPDNSRLAFFSNPNGHFDLFDRSSKSGPEELLVRSDLDKYASDWSPDGRFILYGNIGQSTNSDVWVLPTFGDRRPFPYVQTVSSEGYAVFSPDGKWVAYQSDESGRAEVYVERFPRPVGANARRWQVSVSGGGLPKWRRDGKELYYMTAEGKVMAAEVKAGDAFAADPPRPLFQSHTVPKTWNLFDVTPDGRRFLVNSPMDWASTSPITVVANWTAALKR